MDAVHAATVVRCGWCAEVKIQKRSEQLEAFSVNDERLKPAPRVDKKERHEIFDEIFQAELAQGYADRPQGQPQGQADRLRSGERSCRLLG